METNKISKISTNESDLSVNETTKELHEEPPTPTLSEIYNVLNKLVLTVNNDHFTLVELKIVVATMQNSLTDIYNTLKMIEMVVCLHDETLKGCGRKPPNPETEIVEVEKNHDSVHAKVIADKGKTVQAEWDDGSNNIFLTVSDEDDEGDTNIMNVGQIIPTLETSINAFKARVPSVWTQKDFALINEQNLLVKSTNDYRLSLAKKDKLIVKNDIAKQLCFTPSPKAKGTAGCSSVSKLPLTNMINGHYKEMSITFGTWEIEEVRGIQNCGSNEKSAL